MDSIRQYLLSVIAAAIICAVLIKIAGQKSLLSSMIKLLAGLFMSITVISPLIKLQISDFSNYLEDLELDAENFVEEGQLAASSEKSLIITQQIESYILDKAASLGVNVEVQVVLSDTDEQTPSSVILTGDVSPYAKQQLRQIIADDLGIPEEHQTWT